MAKLIGAQVDFLARKGAIFKDQDSLVRLKKTPFLYPITDVDHITGDGDSEWRSFLKPIIDTTHQPKIIYAQKLR